jgi:hypothetical protein
MPEPFASLIASRRSVDGPRERHWAEPSRTRQGPSARILFETKSALTGVSTTTGVNSQNDGDRSGALNAGETKRAMTKQQETDNNGLKRRDAAAVTPRGVAPLERGQSVLQTWVLSLSFMQQTVLMTALRGADTVAKLHPSKYLLRWYRRCVLYSAFDRCVLTDPHDPRGGSFTGSIEANSLDELASKYLRSVDEMPLHFHLHLVHAVEILGYKHPDANVRTWWNGFYNAAVRDMHLRPESEEDLDRRLGDDLEDWRRLGGEQEPITGRLYGSPKER